MLEFQDINKKRKLNETSAWVQIEKPNKCSEGKKLYWRRSIKSLKMPFSEFQGTLVQKVMQLIRKAMGMDTKIKIVLTFMNRWTLEVADDQSSQMIRL